MPSQDANHITEPGIYNSDVLTLKKFKEIRKDINIDGLSILQLNVRGINEVKKFNKIKQMLKEMKLNLDIIVFGETKLIEDKNYKIENYQKFICCRYARYAGGGVLVFIHKDIKASEQSTYTPSSEKIKIDLVDRNTTLICYYRRSEAFLFEDFMKDIEIEMRTCGNKNVIIVGDFNLHKTKDSLLLKQYLLLLTCYNFQIMNNAVTRNESRTIIDHLIINFQNECNVRNYTVENDISDHNMVLSFISEVNISSNAENVAKKYINYDKMRRNFNNFALEARLEEKKEPVIIVKILFNLVVRSLNASIENVKNGEKIDYSDATCRNKEARIEEIIIESIKSIEEDGDLYVNQLVNQILLNQKGQEKIDQILDIFEEFGFTLTCKIIQKFILNNLNIKFNNRFKKLNQTQKIIRDKNNKEIAPCELWQEIQEALDKTNNKVSLISLDLKNIFCVENIKKLFEKLFSKKIKEEISKLHKSLRGTIFLYGNNYILMNSNVILDDLDENIQHDIKIIHKFLCIMNFKLNNEETRFMILSTTKGKIKYDDLMKIKISKGETIKIAKSDTIKYLDLIIDENKSWKEHINFVVMKIAPVVGYLWKSKKKSFKARKQFYIDFIENRLKNLISIWGYPENSDYLEPLQWIQNMALRLVYNTKLKENVVKKTLCDDMFAKRSNQFEIYFNNTERFFPIRGLYIIEIISLIKGMINGNIQSSLLNSNDNLEPKYFRTLTACRSLKCLGVILYIEFLNDLDDLDDLTLFLVENEKYIKLFLNSKNFKKTMDKYIG